MRVNVYAEELTSMTELVTKVVDAGTPAERTFYGVRIFLNSPIELHHSPNDDDRSAVTFWVPWTKADGHDFALVETVLQSLKYRLSEAINAEITKRTSTRAAQREHATV